ncbi:ribosome silencing factor [Desulfonema ishimotonii]|uniref:Ribosomal silencing factor RsfS n=1 Tax=Desulfonema ishimotonii TaxID=45657 RepID=A0A401FXW4_9BACT|nr:ribosome silencing factor [Desulfonema ishimotonii]GBC61789.1 ribosome silencing factor [Desulfonema ishimotonii]
MTFESSLDVYVKAALGKKASGLLVLDVRGMTSIADAFIVCSGRSNRQVSAIAEHIQRELKKQKIKPLSVEGIKEGHWVLLDYGDVIIHVFYDSVRNFYDLEGLWADAERIKTPALIDYEQKLETEAEEELVTEDDDEEF